jgi:hypothetical protein
VHHREIDVRDDDIAGARRPAARVSAEYLFGYGVAHDFSRYANRAMADGTVHRHGSALILAGFAPTTSKRSGLAAAHGSTAASTACAAMRQSVRMPID